MFWYPVHRHRLPSRPCLISSSVGSGLRCKICAAAMIIPGVQYPHCNPWCSQKPLCTGCSSPPCASPSIVVTVEPSACAASTVQLFTAWPSTITVHAPHSEVSQPTCVPVRLSTSRRYCTSSKRGSISLWCVTPFTVMLIVFFMGHLSGAARGEFPQLGNFCPPDILNVSQGTCYCDAELR